VRLVLSQVDSQVRLEIHDNGVGFDAGSALPGHFGLNTMRERATGLGGTLAIESLPGEGTIVRAIIPANEAAR
jgi:signal transduction histidine kinase